MVTRIVPDLAVEIGLNESIMLLQIAFWINQSSNLRDGQWWTYQSVRDMQQKAFPYWSLATINRTVAALEAAGFICVGNYNAAKFDRTRWLALNPEALAHLTSVKVVFQNDTRTTQNDTRTTQNDTTIPETPTEITAEREAPPAPEPPKPTPSEVDSAIYDAPRTVRGPQQFPPYGPRAEQVPALKAERSMQTTHPLYQAYAAQFETPLPAPSRADMAAAWWADDSGYTPAHIAKATAHRLKAGKGSTAFKFVIMDIHTLLADSGPVLQLVPADTPGEPAAPPPRLSRAEVDALLRQAVEVEAKSA